MQDFLSNLSTKSKAIIIGGMALIIIVIFVILYFNFYSDNSDTIITNDETNQVNEVDSSIFKIGNQSKKIIIHIIGEVNTPGVYTLDENSRIKDAIESAGGETENADLSKVNLAYVIEDGMQIYVPRIGEKLEDSYISEEAGEGIIVETELSDVQNNSKVNINTANIDKLKSLPGIGDATAQKIIDYRNQNGKFKSIEDLKNISGIGDNKFENIKSSICI